MDSRILYISTAQQLSKFKSQNPNKNHHCSKLIDKVYIYKTYEQFDHAHIEAEIKLFDITGDSHETIKLWEYISQLSSTW